MQNIFRYWQLVMVQSDGQAHARKLSDVQTWVNDTFADLIAGEDAAELELQAQLLTHWRSQSAQSDQSALAQLSLRCYLSHQIRYVCVQLANQFGVTYGFSAADLLPLVLNDDGQPSPPRPPLSLEILTTYNPDKARLSTWASQITKNHPVLNRALLDYGLYRASDWAILTDTTPAQVERILSQYHLCSHYEVAEAVELLRRFHQVYSRDRLQQRRTGRGGRCQPPTEEQLQQMFPTGSPRLHLAQLKQLAAQLRQYRVHARGGNPVPYQPSDAQWTELAAGSTDTAEAEDQQQEFLSAYRQVLRTQLDNAIAQTIRGNLPKLQNRNPPKDQIYLQGLHLFHCRGMGMSQLAPHIGLKTQVQVNRLLNLKPLRSSVRARLIQHLQVSVGELARQYMSSDQLNRVSQTLESLLTQEVEQLIDEATKEAQSPHRKAAASLFAHQLCQTLCSLLQRHE